MHPVGNGMEQFYWICTALLTVYIRYLDMDYWKAKKPHPLFAIIGSIELN